MPRTPTEWRDRLRRFAADECRPSSRLYEVVSLGMADDPELLEWIASTINPRVDATSILAAVHDRLLAGVADGGLAAFYPNLTARPSPPDGAYPALRAFVLAHRDELAALLAERTTQTNEVRRCSYLLPALVFAAGRTARPLALIDVGASAGLNLLFDRYGYDYGDGWVCGAAASSVQIATQSRGARPPLAPWPTIAGRIGIDLTPVALGDGAATRWLEACVWPEHVDRFALLRAALAIGRAAKPRVIAGNAIEVLPTLIESTDTDAAIVVVNTNVIQYFSPDERAAYGRVLRDAGDRRELFWIANEHRALLRQAGFAQPIGRASESSALPLAISHWHDGGRDEFVLAEVGPHGRWLNWFD
ncbi:MAG TPA: DUF2332 domain-containing protein [Pseudomonadales bacterium]|nr:DUF2332 domain-containing protein [Pseudomonadales bacterium]